MAKVFVRKVKGIPNFFKKINGEKKGNQENPKQLTLKEGHMRFKFEGSVSQSVFSPENDEVLNFNSLSPP